MRVLTRFFDTTGQPVSLSAWFEAQEEASDLDDGLGDGPMGADSTEFFDGSEITARSDDADRLDLAVRAAGEEDGSTLFVASTGAIDRMGDVVDQGTWRLANFRRNPVILADHGIPVVGAGTAKVVDADAGKRLEVRVRWDDSEVNPIGMLIAHQHRNGFRHAGSVGFRPGKAINRLDLPDDDPRKARDVERWRAGYVFMLNELLEFSSVSVPANPEAVQLSATARGHGLDDEAALRSFVSESVSKGVAQSILDAVQNDPQVRAAIRGMVWAEPKPGNLHELFRGLKP